MIYFIVFFYRIRRKGRDERNKIYPPLFIIEYGELNEMQIENDADVELEFSVNYELDGGTMIHGIEVRKITKKFVQYLRFLL